MKKKRFGVEQIVGVLKQAEVRVPVVELIRKVGISEQTFYQWKAKYVGLEVDPGAPDETVAGREPAVEAVGGRADARQGDASGRALKKMGKTAFAAWTDGGASGKYLPESVGDMPVCRVLCVARAYVSLSQPFGSTD